MKKGIKTNKTKLVNQTGGISSRESKEESKSNTQAERTMIDKELFESKL